MSPRLACSQLPLPELRDKTFGVVATMSDLPHDGQDQGDQKLPPLPPAKFLTPGESSTGLPGGGQTIGLEHHELILSLLPMVKSVVGRIAISLPSHISQEDLLSAGLMGLLDAIRKFDPSKGCSIKSYAATRVRGAVLDELRSMDWAPRSVHRQARDFRKVQQGLEQRLGREATEQELAQELKVSRDELDHLLESIRPTSFISLQDIRSNQEGDSTLAQEECILDPNAISPLTTSMEGETHALIAEEIRSLNPVEQKVLALYYHEGLRLKEIAETLHVTESRVSQIHTLAIQRLRGRLERAQNPISIKK